MDARRGDREKEKEQADVGMSVSVNGDCFFPPYIIVLMFYLSVTPSTLHVGGLACAASCELLP